MALAPVIPNPYSLRNSAWYYVCGTKNYLYCNFMYYCDEYSNASSLLGFSKSCKSRILISRKRDLAVNPWRLSATTQTHIVDTALTRTSTVEIPVSCYQLLGIPNQAEKDEIVKAVLQLKNAEIEEGYTMDSVISRQDLLMDVRDKLLFEPEYAGNAREKIPPRSSLRIPWAWLPGALCILQEVGEEKRVLDIGQASLQYPEAKPYIHDLLLSMALAECAIAKLGFEKNKVSQGFEALARAQCLLKSKMSLGKMALLSQIEDSLEELAPACTLELLGMPHSSENAERRSGAIAALRELLRQGLDVETSCRVQDWPCFLSQALNRLMATEIVDLLPWDDLAATRKNKKSLESQNQRVVIDFNCFYVALIAHIAIGFSIRKTELITKAKIICDCLIASEGIDLKFEETFCLFLLGQGNEAEVFESLQQLELNSGSASRNSIPRKEIKDVSRASPSLELWLKDVVLVLFPDTRDCSPSLVSFFCAQKKFPGCKKSKGAVESIPVVSHRPLSSDLASEQKIFEKSVPYLNSSRHNGSAVKQLAPSDLQSPLLSSKNSSGINVSAPSHQLKRNFGIQHREVWESWLALGDLVRRVTFVMVLGCIVFATFNLSVMNLRRMTNASRCTSSEPNMDTSLLVWTKDSSLDYNAGPLISKGSGIARRIRKLLAMVRMQLHLDAGNPQSPGSAASLSSFTTAAGKRLMPVEEAEDLVKKWQTIKAEALGPSYQIHNLCEVLDESMLVQWKALAEAARAESCFWRFVLLQLSILRADILSDGFDSEMAEIEALLEEAAELVDESQPKNTNYYSTYKVRYVLKKQDDGTWRFCEGDIHTPS